MHRLFRKLENAILQPFEFFANFLYFAHQPRYSLIAAWQQAGKVVKS